MPYIDRYLVPLPRANKSAYEALARISAAVHQSEIESESYGTFIESAGAHVT